MLDFIGTPWGFGSITVVCLLLGYIIWKTGYIVLEKFGITIGKAKFKKASPHTSCPHAKDIMEIIHRTSEFYEKMHDLKTSIIEEQMRLYEEVEEEAISELKHSFINLITEKFGPNEQFIENQEYAQYTLILKVISQDIKSYIRGCFKTNHYIEYEPEEQLDYVEKKKNLVIQKVNECLNIYWRCSTITRSDIYKRNKDNIKFYEKCLEDIFNNAFSTSREIHAKMDKLEASYKLYINETVGVQE